MATTTVTLDLSKFGITGINAPITIKNVEEIVNGKGIEEYGTRSPEERQQIKDVIEQIQSSSSYNKNLPKNIQADLEGYNKRIQEIENRINDPIGNYLSKVKEEAMAGPGWGAVAGNIARRKSF